MLEIIFSQYKEYSNIDIALEITTIIFAIISVYFAKKNNVLLYPTGIINTAIYVYLLWKWNLLGDMIINFYLCIMSIYGWFVWSYKKEGKHTIQISKTKKKEYINSVLLFTITIILTLYIYIYFEKLEHWTNYLDILVTGLLFVGMYLLAKRKIENWIFLIIADIISVPMYFAKGYAFSGLLYLTLTIIAIFGYIEWRKYLAKQI